MPHYCMRYEALENLTTNLHLFGEKYLHWEIKFFEISENTSRKWISWLNFPCLSLLYTSLFSQGFFWVPRLGSPRWWAEGRGELVKSRHCAQLWYFRAFEFPSIQLLKNFFQEMKLSEKPVDPIAIYVGHVVNRTLSKGSMWELKQ